MYKFHYVNVDAQVDAEVKQQFNLDSARAQQTPLS